MCSSDERLELKAAVELVRGLQNLHERHRGCVLTIGAFDGIHCGHQEMIRVVRSCAAAHRLPATVLSFEPTPREFFSPQAPPARLTRFREKYEALCRYGIDRFVCLRFNERLRSMPAEQFVLDVLVRGLGMRHVVVGHDFRFGRKLSGSVDTLQQLGAQSGFGVTQVPPFEMDGERVSSSLVRAALSGGDMQRAARLLGRPCRMSGKVVAGERLGRRLGFPTANLRPRRLATPLAGVFAVRVCGAGLQDAAGVASLGTRPVVGGGELLLEVHVFDFHGDLYRRYLHVDFISRLRAEQPFASLEALIAQMHQDAAQAREILGVQPRR